MQRNLINMFNVMFSHIFLELYQNMQEVIKDVIYQNVIQVFTAIFTSCLWILGSISLILSSKYFSYYEQLNSYKFNIFVEKLSIKYLGIYLLKNQDFNCLYFQFLY